MPVPSANPKLARKPVAAFPAANDDFRKARTRCSLSCDAFNSLPESATSIEKGKALLDIIPSLHLRSDEPLHEPPSQEKSGGKQQGFPYIKPPFIVDYGIHIHIGAHSFINRGCTILDSPVAEIRIGMRCQFGPGVHIYCVGHPLAGGERNGRSGYSTGYALTIEDDVWLGGRTVVLGGITIGKGAVVAAGSVVTRDVPAGHLAVGNPARVVACVDPDIESEYPLRLTEEPSKWVGTIEEAAALGLHRGRVV